MITYKDFREYQDYMKKQPPLQWLTEFDRYLSEKYGVRLMPTLYDETQSGKCYLHRFFIVPYSDEDYKRLMKFMEGENSWDCVEIYRREFRKDLDIFISRYDTPRLKENGVVLPVLEHSYLWHYKYNYLLGHKMWEMRDRLSEYFDYLKPVDLTIDGRVCCVLETRKQAAEFYRSPQYRELSEKLCREIKAYDEYDVLTPENIHILTDYREHYESTPMYYRWRMDMTLSESIGYMDSL